MVHEYAYFLRIHLEIGLLNWFTILLYVLRYTGQSGPLSGPGPGPEASASPASWWTMGGF